MDVEERIKKALKEAFQKLDLPSPTGIEDIEPRLEHPSDLLYGDYSTNVALAAAKKAGINPKELAEKIRNSLPEIEGILKTETAGSGFINFHLSRDFFREGIEEIIKNEKWGEGEILLGKRLMYEYTDPNPFKVFHIGHLMSNAIGESLARLAKGQGGTVLRANYQGDIGPHVAKCIWGLREENLDTENIDDLGKAYVMGSAAYEDSESAKAEIDAINKALYANDPEFKDLYDRGRKTSLEHFEELYKVLGTKFDYYFFESEMWPVGMELVREGLEKGVFEESEGAVVYRGEKKALHTRVFITKAGTPTYEAKDLGLNKTKFEKEKLDHSLIMTGAEQVGYFAVVLAAMAELLPEVALKTEHVFHGLMQLSSGKMSSRTGSVVSGESLIEEMRAKAAGKMEGRDLGEEKQKIADMVAVAAIKYSILKQATGKNIIFDPEQSLSFEGDSGPYLQYAHVRAKAVLRKAEEEKVDAGSTHVPLEVSELERLLYRFPEITQRAQKENEPHHVTTYLTEIASAFNSWYAIGKIVDAADDTSPYKVMLTEAFARTMKNGLWLLGIQAPERM